MKYFVLLFILTLGMSSLHAQDTGTLKMTVMDIDIKEPVLFCNIALYQDGILKTGGQTDFDGIFEMKNITMGTYDIEVTYIGYHKSRIENVKILANEITSVNVLLQEVKHLGDVVIITCTIPIITDPFGSGKMFTSESIEKLPIKN